ncbi:MAG: type II toxin-antitoxin system RelE/ParE family toxin [bacterium]|nr:type II toxin-antitoxin system RelE/ParE family toxin [bacterium]
MAWTIKWEEQALKEAGRLDGAVRRKILKYLRQRIATDADPKRFGKALRWSHSGLWRYRVGDYRIVCRIEQDRGVVKVIRVAHRSEVYD